MSSELYFRFHRKNKEEEKYADLITLEETDPGNRYQTISYTRFKEGVSPNRISPIKTIYWNLNSAKEWFCECKKKTDPETKLPILSYPTFMSRIRYQLKLKELFEDGYSPDDSHIKDLFLKYISSASNSVANGKSVGESEEILLHNFFHIDNTILMKWSEEVSDPLKHRELANNMISQAENGSWLIRHTSVKESDIVKARVITFKSMDGSVKHIVIAHIYGYGYVLPRNISSGQEMPSLGSGNYINVEKDLAFPSFISLLLHIIQKTDCDFILHKLLIG